MALTVPPGVYLDSSNYNSLVFKSDEHDVYFVARLDDKVGFDVHSMSVQSFVQRYWRTLPDYPVRRCARVYHDSLFAKTALATRVLNHLMHT